MNDKVDAVQESIKLALDAADAATDVTSEYNTVRKQHKILEDKVKICIKDHLEIWGQIKLSLFSDFSKNFGFSTLILICFTLWRPLGPRARPLLKIEIS